MRTAWLLALVIPVLACVSPNTRGTDQQERLDRRTREVRTRLAAEEVLRAEVSGSAFDAMVEGMSSSFDEPMAEVFEAQFGRQPTREESERMQQVLLDAIGETYPAEVWIEALVPVYTSIYSMEELEALAAFYATPEGERISKLRGIAMREAGRAGGKLGATRDSALYERIGQGLVAEFAELSPRADQSEVQAAVLTISEATAICNRIQEEPSLPIGCSIEYYDNGPAMLLIFPDAQAASEYWQAVYEEVAAPFCDAANRGNRLALVVLGVYASRQMRSYNCESGELSDWIAVDDDQAF